MFRKLNNIVYVFLSAFGVAGVIAYFILFGVMLLGYVMNLFKIVWAAVSFGFLDNLVLFGLRFIGIFIGPLGGVVGWF
jgi:hypothetical protein